MARIQNLKPNAQSVRPHRIEKGVTCEHQVVDDGEGRKLLHLTTLGSKTRQSQPKSSQSLQLDADVAAQLIDVMRAAFGDRALNIQPALDIAFPPPDIGVDPDALAMAYQQRPELFRKLVTNDATAGDVVAMAHRRQQVARFRRLLEDDDYFDQERKSRFPNRGGEAVWQEFFEQNPWIFGVSLAGQLLTSWSDEKLEQVVAGSSISSVGKRTDALLRTSGRIKSMVFAEIKTHRKELLEPIKEPYRPGCWAPSFELSGGVVQAQGTVHLAVAQMRDRLQEKASDGSDLPGEFTYLLRPRSYLIIGNLDSLKGEAGGYHETKFRSFELFRREMIQPEILTFDEVLARAEWAVETTQRDAIRQ
ncbi:Shedu immune nuclease family protein [Nocardia sp. NPDC052254]|uniref:Shedu immune nuclease family protein n=1 Tax=Nocardia sp. NPDC052254 TaxID=3155681 RepID=UPI00342F8F56